MKNEQANQQRYIWIRGEQVAVTEEEYRAFMQPIWAERKRLEREMRCRDETGSRCKKDCRLCERSRAGRPLSLEQFAEDGYEIATHTSPADIVIRKHLVEALNAALDDLDLENRRIIKMLFFDGLTERQTAAVIGLSQKGINKRKNKILRLLRYHLKDFSPFGSQTSDMCPFNSEGK